MPFYVFKIRRRLDNGLVADGVGDGRDEFDTREEAAARGEERWGQSDWVVVEADDWGMAWMKLTPAGYGLTDSELRRLRKS